MPGKIAKCLVANALFSASALANPSPDRGSADLIQSAKGTDDRLSPKGKVLFQDDFEFSGPTVHVGTSDDLDQEIHGFGGAFTEASAILFQGMTPDNQQKLLEKYFDPVNGIGFTTGRVHMNSCDFSPPPAQWSEDDVAGDVDLEHFDTAVSHDQEAMIPFIKAAMQRLAQNHRELKLIAAPWSPPAWMKTNGKMVDEGKNGTLKPEFRAAWAKYFTKWISAYKEQGVPMWAVTPQNEPENPATWEGCVYTAQEQAEWLGEYLGPTLKAAHPDVLIFTFDHNKDHVYDWAKVMYSHPTASNYTDGIAFHWYSGDQFDHIQQIHSEFPKATLLATEATWEKYRWAPGTTAEVGDWAMGEGYSHDIIGDLNAGTVGWTDWNLILDTTGGPNHVGNNCDAAMFADNAKQELYLHPQYYHIGHFSKYIVPGSRRIKLNVTGTTTYSGPNRGYGVCTGDDGLQSTAFKRPDGDIAVVVLNCADNAVNFKLQDGARAASASIPAHAIQTFVFSRTTTIIV